MNVLEQFKKLLKDQGVEDPKIEEIVKAMPGAKVYLASEEKLDERYLKLKGQKELLEDKVKVHESTIETLKKNNGSNEELQNTIKEKDTKIKDLQAKYDRDVTLIDKKQQLISALTKEGAMHPELLVASMDLEKVELKDGKISGHKDAIKALKETYKDQFKAVEDPNGGKDGGKGGEPYNYTPPGGKDGGKGGEPTDIMGAMAAHSVHR